MEFHVYILFSPSFKQTYVGQTSSIANRLKRHNLGQVLSTKRYRPWIQIHTEKLSSRAEAMKREKYLKSGVGRVEVQQILLRFLQQNG